MTDVDMDSYREHNDIPPGEPAPRAPDEQPDGVNEDFRVWMFDAEQSTTVPDTYVVDQHPEPLDFRMWVFAGDGDQARFVMRASHKYAPDEQPPEGNEDCCEVLVEGESLTAEHCPEAVEQLVSDLTAAEVHLPESTDRGGPVRY
ncbi:hypothetical protein [Halovenus marina]|uniref:hypothetical protein n=1 Tax=Halovenus marina TaxID=3396621 RepID=UPI003F566D5F